MASTFLWYIDGAMGTTDAQRQAAAAEAARTERLEQARRAAQQMQQTSLSKGIGPEKVKKQG